MMGFKRNLLFQGSILVFQGVFAWIRQICLKHMPFGLVRILEMNRCEKGRSFTDFEDPGISGDVERVAVANQYPS